MEHYPYMMCTVFCLKNATTHILIPYSKILILPDLACHGFGMSTIGLTDEHMTLLYAMTAVVLAED